MCYHTQFILCRGHGDTEIRARASCWVNTSLAPCYLSWPQYPHHFKQWRPTDREQVFCILRTFSTVPPNTGKAWPVCLRSAVLPIPFFHKLLTTSRKSIFPGLATGPVLASVPETIHPYTLVQAIFLENMDSCLLLLLSTSFYVCLRLL